MKAENWVFLNHQFVLKEKAFIPISDQGFLFGEGVFTTICVNEGVCELFGAHMNRLETHLKELQFPPYLIEKEWIKELIQRNHANQGCWRLKIILTGLRENTKTKISTVLMTLEPYQKSFSSAKLCFFPECFESPIARVKSMSYMINRMALQYANNQGYEDAIFRNIEKIILETSFSNLFWIEEGICYVPDHSLPYLKGVFLNSLLKLFSFPVNFVQTKQISSKAHVYMCNSLLHVCPVVEIEGKKFARDFALERELEEFALEAISEDHWDCEGEGVKEKGNRSVNAVNLA